MGEEGKVCVGCQEDWPADAEFYREGSAVCLACEAEGVKVPKPKTRGYRTPEAELLRHRQKYARYRERYIARMRRWYAANADALNARRRAKYAAQKQEPGFEAIRATHNAQKRARYAAKKQGV